jgi:hypothetical protein
MWSTTQYSRFLKAATVSMTALALTVGCGSPPLAPTPPPRPFVPPPAPVPAPAPAPAPAAPASASLAIENAYGIGGGGPACTRDGCSPHASYGYEIRFVLRELTGTSGATIKRVVVRNTAQVTNGTYSDETGEACWKDPLRVPPGGTLDTFFTDAGVAWLSYCFVGIDTLPGREPQLELDVHFVDDAQRSGFVTKVVTSYR